MASGEVPDKPKQVHLDRIVDHIEDTLDNSIEVDRVVSLLCQRSDFSKKLKPLLKKISTQDATEFRGLLCKFNFKNFVIFVEVIHLLSMEGDEGNKYSQMFHMLCSEIKSLEEWPQLKHKKSMSTLNSLMMEHDDRLSPVEIKFGESSKEADVSKLKTDLCTTTGESSTATSISITSHEESLHSKCYHKSWTKRQHTVEKKLLEFRSDEGLFCSHTHGIVISASRRAIPCESLHIVLSVDNPGGRVRYPDDYDASYSALVSLTCDPAVEFQDYVTVAIPHCACGDLNSLCVLTAPELCASGEQEDIVFSEDSDIIIQSIDESYFIFQTKHFSMNKVARCMKRRKQRLERELKRNFLSSSSKNGVTEKRFVAIRCERKEAELPLSCSFYITYHLVTCIKKLFELVKEEWEISSITKQVSRPFVFTSSSIQFHPVEDSKSDGWILKCSELPAQLRKKVITDYLDKENCEYCIPSMEYMMYYNGTNRPRPTDFKVTLQGSSVSLSEQSAISMLFPCSPNPILPSSAKQSAFTIMITTDMYVDKSPLLQALRGHNPSYELSMEKYECRVLLCEISLQLQRRTRFASSIGLSEDDIHVAQSDRNSPHPFEKTYSMLSTWVRRPRGPPRTFTQLVSQLHACDTKLCEGSWDIQYDTRSLKECDEQLFRILHYHIMDVWKFIARLLEMKLNDIYAVEANSRPQTVQEFAYQMLRSWKSDYGDSATCLKLFNAIHCIDEHTDLCSGTLCALLK